MNPIPAIALFTRSLMLRTRALDGAWLRLGLGFMVFAMLVVQTLSEAPFQSAPGLALLETLAWTAMLTTTVLALALFAPAITEEKEAGTLGLLRMTGLDALGLLLAKSTTRLLEAAMLLAVTLPLLLIAITLGGVNATQVLAVYLALATWLVLLAQLGLFWSVVAATTVRAVLCTLLTLVLVPFAWAVAWWITGGQAGPLDGLYRWLFESSILGRLGEILSTGYAGGLLGRADALHLALALMLFCAAWICINRQGDQQGADGSAVDNWRSPAWWRRIADRRRAGRPPRGLAAIAWKDRRLVLGGAWWFGLRVMAALGIILLVCVNVDGGSPNRVLCLSLVFIAVADLIAGVGIPLIIAFADEERLLTADALRILPVGSSALFYAKWRALWPGWAWNLLLWGFLLVIEEAPDSFPGLKYSLWSEGLGYVFIAMALAYWNLGVLVALFWSRSAVFIAGGAIVAIQMAMVVLENLTRYDMPVFISLLVGAYAAIAVISHVAALRRFCHHQGAGST